MRTRLETLNDTSGFTLIELLSVFLILSVLAALAIPAFFGQSAKSRDAIAKQDVDTAQTTIELIGRDRGGYATIAVDDLRAEEPVLNGANLVEPETTDTTYTVGAVSANGTTFTVSRLGPAGLDYDCAPRGGGGCPPDGNWGE